MMYDVDVLTVYGSTIGLIGTIVYSWRFNRANKKKLDYKYKAQIEEQKQYILALIFKNKEDKEEK